MEPGRCARVLLDGREIGVVGEMHPCWKQKYELADPAVMFEIELAALLATPMPVYAEVSRFPAVVRDIALVVSVQCEVASLLAALHAAAPVYVREIQLFDVYQGKGIAMDSKSLAFRVSMQDTRKTLADSDADVAMASLLSTAKKQFGAELRG